MTSLCFTFQKFLDKSVEESGDKEKSEDYSVSLRHVTKISTLALLLLVLLLCCKMFSFVTDVLLL